MMKRPFVILVVFALVSGWYSCTKDTAIAPPPAPVCDSTHVSYAQSVAPVMNKYCTLSGCHGNPLGASANDLTTLANVRNAVEIDSPNVNSLLCRVQATTCGSDIMPQGTTKGLKQIYVDTIKLWKAGGYCE